MAVTPGTRIGPYEVTALIGMGGMGEVYRARDTRLQRDVAIKLLPASVAGDPERLARFTREAQLLATLNHPHIAAIYGVEDSPSGPALVLEVIEGPTLADRIAQGPLPVVEATAIALQIADALEAAHEQGIVHRDLKPANVKVRADGKVKVLDFGLAKHTTATAPASGIADIAASPTFTALATGDGIILGTAAYMAPEQARGRTVDRRADIWAFGVVLFEMLVGRRPFGGETISEMLAAIIKDPPALDELPAGLPRRVTDLIRRTLEKDPRRRLRDIGEARLLLEDHAADPAERGDSQGRSAAAPPSRRWSVTHPVIIVLGAVIFGLGALLVWQTNRGTPVARADVTRFTLELPSDSRLAIYSLAGPNMAFSPDGRVIAFVADGPDGTRRLYLRSLADADARVVPATEGAAQPAFSPDGRWIAYLAGGRLMRVERDSGTRQPIIAMSDLSGFTWAGNSMLVLSSDAAPSLGPAAEAVLGEGPAGLLTVSVTDGTVGRLTNLDTSENETLQESPVALPDGEHVLYASWGRGGPETIRIGVASLSSRASKVLDLRGVTPLGMIDGHVIYATTNNDLLAAPVDLTSGRVLAQPITLASGVMIGTGGVAKAALSVSGSLAYLGGANESQLVMARPGGISNPVLPEVRPYGYPRFSPDGKRIAITIGSGPTSDIWIYDSQSRTSMRLTSGGSINERPEWTSDGQRVLFRSDRGGTSSIWWQRADHGDQASPFIADPGNAYFEAVISPDGQHVVYQVDNGGADVEYRALRGDTASKAIARTAALEYSARLSPDGKWVAYVTDESGSRQVVVQPFPGPGPRVQVSTTGGSEPVWTRDGRRIIFRGAGKFTAADVVTAPVFSVVSRTDLMDDVFLAAVSPHANFDVAPDGNSLLVLRPTGTQRVFIVTNWAEEVRDRLRQNQQR